MEGEMKTIEQRAAKWGEYIAERTTYDVVGAKYSYIAGANEQKEIDDDLLLKLKSSWEEEAQINHNDKSNYKQGYHDAVNKACELLKAVGVLTDDDSIMGFIKAMEK